MGLEQIMKKQVCLSVLQMPRRLPVAHVHYLGLQSWGCRNLSSTLSHVDGETNRACMVEISGKRSSERWALAQSLVHLPPQVVSLLTGKNPPEILSKKGPVFATAVIAGTMAVKRTSELIPFCHPLLLEACDFDIQLLEQPTAQDHQGSAVVQIRCSVKVQGKTGVEMEALTGASVAALTVYDMLKAVSHDIVLAETRLLSKTGGKSDYSLDKTGGKPAAPSAAPLS
eukprot:g25589.t1